MGDTISWDDVFNEARKAAAEERENTVEDSPDPDASETKGKRRRKKGGHTGGSPSGGMPVNFNFKPRSKKFWIIAVIIFLLIIAFLYWWFHPSLNIHSEGLWWFVGIIICLPVFLVFYIARKTNERKSASDEVYTKKAKRFKYLSYLPIAIIVIGLIGSLCSATFFPGNAKRYASVLVTEEYEFANDIDQVDYREVPVIDRDAAIILGNRALGSIPDYVSQFEISDLYSQINYDDTPVRVSPLGYADIFKWFRNRGNGIPAYVIVDMTTQDTRVMRLSEGMKYTQSEPFNRNINRYVQLHYPFYLFEQFSFEIDEEGNPWWVCPVQTRTIGLFGGETISRAVLVNACTGECQDVAIEDVPQWVDRAYPADLLITQYNWSGLYSGGWWNSWIGQAGVKQTTPGSDGLLGYNYIAKDDDVWVYTGVTSATADNSIIGFVLVNQRTAESHFYSVAGATEESAMASAQGQVQHLHYTATFPILLNIDGQPTYFMALKDAAGLAKQYAMLDIQRYQNVAIGDTVSNCQASYEALLATNGVLTEDTAALANATTVSGVIVQIATAVIDGNSHFYLMLEGDDRVYDCALPGMITAVTLQPGDTVTLKFVESSPTCTVTELALGEAPS